METMLVLLILSCLIILVCGSRHAWQRQRCPKCGSYGPAGYARCAYCTQARRAPTQA